MSVNSCTWPKAPKVIRLRTSKSPDKMASVWMETNCWEPTVAEPIRKAEPSPLMRKENGKASAAPSALAPNSSRTPVSGRLSVSAPSETPNSSKPKARRSAVLAASRAALVVKSMNVASPIPILPSSKLANCASIVAMLDCPS